MTMAETNTLQLKVSTDLVSTDTLLMNVDGALSRVKISELAAALALAYGKKSYQVLLSQSGTAAPTAVVQVNTLGATPVLARTGVGVYTVTGTGLFPIGKTSKPSLDTVGIFEAIITHVDENTFSIETFDTDGNPVDGVLSSHLLEVYTS